MKKKAFLVLLFLAMATFVVACNKKEEDTTTKESTTTEATTESTSREVAEEYKEVKITGNSKSSTQIGDPQKGETVVEMTVKDFGTMKFKFFLKEAPLAVKNFVTLAANGYYDGLKFHRVINDFMIQSGDPSGNGTGGESIWKEDFENEINDSLLPLRGALCMANTGTDSSNGSQFFIVQTKADSITDEMFSSVSLTDDQMKAFKEQGGYPSLTGGYTVFGQMYDGYDVLDKIAAVETVSDAVSEDRPKEDVVIEKITVTNYKE